MRAAHRADATAAEARECPWCRAAPGRLCRSTSGRLAAYHAERLWPGQRQTRKSAGILTGSDLTDSDDW